MEVYQILRIVAGNYGGRVIRAPVGVTTRPTSQRVREALFSILRPCIEGAVFADIFAGSGAVGIEALSRGASSALFADLRPRCIDLIRDNLAAVGARVTDAALVCADLSSAAGYKKLRAAPAAVATGAAAAVDIVFADPPYALSNITSIPDMLAASGILAAGALLVVEHGAKLDMPDAPAENAGHGSLSGRGIFGGRGSLGVSAAVTPVYRKTRVKRYGDTSLSFYMFGENGGI